MQDAYLRAVSSLDAFRGEARLGTWLAHPARRAAVVVRRVAAGRAFRPDAERARRLRLLLCAARAGRHGGTPCRGRARQAPGACRSTGSRVALRPGTGWLFLLRRGRCFPRSQTSCVATPFRPPPWRWFTQRQPGRFEPAPWQFVRNFSFIGRQFRLHRTFTSCCARAASDVLTAKRSRT